MWSKQSRKNINQSGISIESETVKECENWPNKETKRISQPQQNQQATDTIENQGQNTHEPIL